MLIHKIISENLTRWMKEGKLPTINDVVRKSGLSFGTVQRMVTATGNPSIANCVIVARAFNKSVLQLLTRKWP